MTSSLLRSQLLNVLEQSAQKLNLTNYTKNVNIYPIPGLGFLSDLFKLSLTDNVRKEEIKLAVKKTPSVTYQRSETLIAEAFKNELHFYNAVLPEFKRMEKKHKIKTTLAAVPGFITSLNLDGSDFLVMNDITDSGYELREQAALFDDQHVKKIFRTYGHFHALSFALKDQEPERFQKVATPIIPVWERSLKKDPRFGLMFIEQAEKTLQFLQDSKEKVIAERFRKYTTNMKEIFLEAANYRGQYFSILHGDCGSNNYMFRYKDINNEKGIDSVTLLDFQQLNLGTPVFDLASSLYIGGSKELFKHLEKYLDIYYESFANAASNLGSNPAKLLPRDQLSIDWREHSKLGMILALLLSKVKLMSKEELIKCTSFIPIDDKDPVPKASYNESVYNQRIHDVLEHLNEIDAL